MRFDDDYGVQISSGLGPMSSEDRLDVLLQIADGLPAAFAGDLAEPSLGDEASPRLDQMVTGSGSIEIIYSTNAELDEAESSALADALQAGTPHATDAAILDDGRIRVTAQDLASVDIEAVRSNTPTFEVDLRPVLASAPCSDAHADGMALDVVDGSTICAGPAQAGGTVFSRGSAAVTTSSFGVSVQVELRPGEGEDAWNNVASQCFNRVESCPSGQLAIVVNGAVVSAPTVNQPTFQGMVSIAGDFDEIEAQLLADTINLASIPLVIELDELARFN